MRVAGLDLSLTGAAAVVLDEGWGLDFDAVPSIRVGEALPADASDADQLGRLVRIKLELLDFLAEQKATHIYVEQYAFSRGASRAHALGELGGCVKLGCLLDLGLPVRSVTASAARKVLLGKVPRAGSKLATARALASMGAPSRWSSDALDAFAVANFGLVDLGCRSGVLMIDAA